MPYRVDWSNTAFPLILEDPLGEPWLVVARTVAVHHLVAATDHLRAAERLVAGVPGQED